MLLAEPPEKTGTEDYKVGPGKPPLETQFGGPRANPSGGGRPKGAISLKSAVRRRLASRELADKMADHVIDLALAHDAKVAEILALGTFHDDGLVEAPESVAPAAQKHTSDAKTKALIAALRASGHEKQARELEEEENG